MSTQHFSTLMKLFCTTLSRRGRIKVSWWASMPCDLSRFKAQYTVAVLGGLEESNILVSLVLANCTDRLWMWVLTNQSSSFYVDSSMNGLLVKCPNSCKVVRKLTRVKPLAATWLMDYLKMHPEITVNGFHQAGLL